MGAPPRSSRAQARSIGCAGRRSIRRRSSARSSIAERGGSFRIGPAGPLEKATLHRRYLEGTPVLETQFVVEGGALRLTDLMPALSEEEKRGAFVPDHELLRRLECTGGAVEVELRCAPRPDFGRCRLEVSAPRRARGALRLGRPSR